MKPIQIIAVLGGLAIVGVVAWYLYMESNPPYEVAPERGLNLPAASGASAGGAAPGTAAPASKAP